MELIEHYKDNELFSLPETSKSNREDKDVLQTLPVYCPATGQQIRQVANASEQELNEIVASSKRASEQWGQTSIATRINILFEFQQVGFIIRFNTRIWEMLKRYLDTKLPSFIFS